MTSTYYTPPKSRAPKQASRPASSRPKRLSPTKQRKLVEIAIERLVALLDEIDPEPDDEPSLGWSTAVAAPQNCSDGYDVGDDREGYGATGPLSLLHEGDDEPDNDGEPSLGSLDRMVNQTRWAEGNSWQDGELDKADDEPSLGWRNEGSQERLHSSPGDREWDCEDEGAEHDGHEPWGVGIPGGGTGVSGI